jgi:hypothetical protein
MRTKAHIPAAAGGMVDLLAEAKTQRKADELTRGRGVSTGGSPGRRAACMSGTARPLMRSTVAITSRTQLALPVPRLSCAADINGVVGASADLDQRGHELYCVCYTASNWFRLCGEPSHHHGASVVALGESGVVLKVDSTLDWRASSFA